MDQYLHQYHHILQHQGYHLYHFVLHNEHHRHQQLHIHHYLEYWVNYRPHILALSSENQEELLQFHQGLVDYLYQNHHHRNHQVFQYLED